METTKQNEGLSEDNRTLHVLITELGKKKSDNIGEWSYWSTLDGEKANVLLREKLTGMLVSGKICTEYDSKNYINKLLKERVNKMNANEIKIGKRHTVKIGKNEVEITVISKTQKGWIVKTSAGKAIPINNAERFLKLLDIPEEITQKEASKQKPKVESQKPKLSMLDAAVEVLKGSSSPMSSKELIAEMEEKNLWKSPKGITPCNSLSAAILRECNQKENPRFHKTEKGRFILAVNNQEKQDPCPDCGVKVGEVHKQGCDVERCSACGGQRLMCDCKGHNPKAVRWTGEWPA